MRRLDDQEHRETAESRRILGRWKEERWPMILLRFHPAILTAVAVFLINMLILHEPPTWNYEAVALCACISPKLVYVGVASMFIRGLWGLQPRVIRNIFDQESMGVCKVGSSLKLLISSKQRTYMYTLSPSKSLKVNWPLFSQLLYEYLHFVWLMQNDKYSHRIITLRNFGTDLFFMLIRLW